MKRLLQIDAAYCAIAVTVIALLLFPVNAMACSCCSDPGERSEETRKIYEDEFDTINSTKIFRSSKLFTTEAFPEGISGIEAPVDTLDEPFNVTLTRDGRKWTMVFSGIKGERGALVFSVPETATFFRVDLQDGKTHGGNGPLLYKEIRLEGNVWGNGIFSGGITPDTKFHLVLQGRGIRCLSPDDLKNWNLRISGSKASYSFYGSFDKPTKQKQK